MTITEAKHLKKLLHPFNPFVMAMLPEEQIKAVEHLQKRIKQKEKQYPKYFKAKV